MATFKVTGARPDGGGASEMCVVTPPGHDKLGFTYLDDTPGMFRVQLDDYNIIFDGAHLKDMTPTHWIEVFGVDPSDGAAGDITQVLTLNSAQNGIVTYFNLGPGQLPDKDGPEVLQLLQDTGQTFQISTYGAHGAVSLTNAPGVKVSGQLQPKPYEALAQDTDHFEFQDSGTAEPPLADVFAIELAYVPWGVSPGEVSVTSSQMYFAWADDAGEPVVLHPGVDDGL